MDFCSLDFIYKRGGDSKLYSLKTSLPSKNFDLLHNSRSTVPMRQGDTSARDHFTLFILSENCPGK